MSSTLSIENAKSEYDHLIVMFMRSLYKHRKLLIVFGSLQLQWRRFGNLRTAKWRTGNMLTNMRTRPLIGRDVTRVPRAVRKVPHGVHSSHCFVSRPNRSLQKVQGHRTAQGRSRRGRDFTHRRPCGTSHQSGDPV